MHARVLATIVLALATVGNASPQDYPQWRGVNGEGAASAFKEPRSWPDALTRRWRAEVGDGYATPLVIGETVYVFTRRDDRELLTALSASTGVTRWRTSYSAPFSPSKAAALHGAGPKATPLFHERKVFTLGISGIVSAFDASTGELLWQTPAPVEHPFFSAASSPVGDAGIVITHPGNYGPLTAFDTSTGAMKWTAGESGFFASPVIVTLDGVRQVISVGPKSVIGVSVRDGATLWQVPWPGASGGPTPVVDGDVIIVSGLNVGTKAFKAARRDGKWQTSLLWENTDVSMYISTPVVVEGTLYGLSHRNSGQFFAVDARTGKTLWLGQPREAANTAIVKAGSLLFMLNDDAELIVARSSRGAFEPVKRYMVAESSTWAQPTISGNRMFIKDMTWLSLWTLE